MALKGLMTYAFTHMGDFLLGLGLLAEIWTPWLGIGPQGWHMGLQARILAFRLGFGPQGWDIGLKTGMWASRLEFGPQDWDLRGGAEEEKIPHMCESTGHRPLWGHCPASLSTSSTTYKGRAPVQLTI